MENNIKSQTNTANIQKTDKELHLEFLKLGNSHRKLTNELLTLLPEIFERKIYQKYAATIVEYAGKFGGLSKGVVLKRLRLEKYLKNKPLLKEAIKTEGVHKIALVASFATEETESLWLDKVKNMSKNAIQELSKEVRSKGMNERISYERSLFDEEIPDPNADSSTGFLLGHCEAVAPKIVIEFDDEMITKFLRLKKKFGEYLSNKELMRRMMDFVEEKISTKETKKIAI